MKYLNERDTINEEELKQEGIDKCKKYCDDYCFLYGFGYCPNCAYYKAVNEKRKAE